MTVALRKWYCIFTNWYLGFLESSIKNKRRAITSSNQLVSKEKLLNWFVYIMTINSQLNR